MPSRDRNHELETESERAFESALPSNLVVRPVSDDYGVDREVEVFTDGQTTGLTFKVQLKGTDKSGKTRRVKRSHLEYWNQLDVPVLLVSYEAPTKCLRARWVHSIGADGPDTGAVTTTVHMDSEIDLAGDWPESLASDLTVLRSLKRGEVPSPVPVRVEIPPDRAANLSTAYVAAALLNASRRTSSPMRAATGPLEAALTLTIAEDRVQAALPLRFASATIHFPSGTLGGADARQIGEMGLMLASAAIATINLAVARSWLTHVSPTAPAWAFADFAERLLPVLGVPESATLLTQVHAHLVELEVPASDIYGMPLIDTAIHVAKNDFLTYSTRIRRVIKSNQQDGGRLAFNLGQLHRQRKEHAEAVELFEIAATMQPAYDHDARFFQGLGGSLWDLDQFEEAATAYTKALALGYDPYELLPLLADSLMYAGRYAEAKHALVEWEPRGQESDRLGILRQVMLTQLVDTLGLERQDRTNYDRDAFQTRYEAALDDDTLSKDVLHDFLRDADALHPLPWMHLVMGDHQDSDYSAALTFAVLTFSSPHAWLVALLQALNCGAEDPLIRAIVDQARFHCREEFYDAVWEAAAHQDDDEATILRDLISAAYSAEPNALMNHIRVLDISHANLIVEAFAFPSLPKPAYFDNDSRGGGER